MPRPGKAARLPRGKFPMTLMSSSSPRIPRGLPPSSTPTAFSRAAAPSGAGDLRLRVADIELDDLLAGPAAGVGDGAGDGQVAVLDGAGNGRVEVAVVEAGVGQTVAERVADLAADGVVAAVADKDPVAVADAALLVLAVEALGLVGRGQAEEDDDRAGPAGEGDGLGGQVLVAVGGADAEPGGVGHLHPGRDGGPELVQGHVDPGGVDLRAAGPLIAGGTGELADDRDDVSGGRAAASFFNSTAHSAAVARARAWWASTSNPAAEPSRDPAGGPTARAWWTSPSTRATAWSTSSSSRVPARTAATIAASLTRGWAASPGPARRPGRPPGRAPHPSRTPPPR
jgi:hypothetical protein